MKQYKEKLKLENRIIVVCIALLSAFIVLSILAEAEIISFLRPVAGDEHWQSKWRGFIAGASGGVLGLMVFGLIQNTRALRNEKKLKELYIAAHDERQIQILTTARSAATQTFLLIGLVAGVIAGYFNPTVSITILACVVAHSLISMGFAFYYRKKY
ncbi:MAG: hypothetical protein IJN53_03600 [Oscillospiraceae bacterium]|nr:hypothetical protein [Oscillospiraceae bacterium]